MARYGTGLYSTFKYGEVPAGSFSVAPFTMKVISYSEIYLYWSMPVSTTGGIIRFRLVRSQDSFPDTPEDGVILLDTTDVAYLNGNKRFDSSALPSMPLVSPDPSFRDGEVNLYNSSTNPNVAYLGQQLIPGKYVYYTIWLLLSDGTWLNSGSVSGLLASDHSQVVTGTDRTKTTHDKVMDLLPRVFTSATNSPLDAIDTTSDLYQFLSAFSYTLDELMTYADLLLPNHLFTNLSPTLLDAKAFEYGFTSENRASSKFQRRLVREAHEINSSKGTLSSIKKLIESMTGYYPVITSSPNLMLSAQDSSFTKGTGFWRTQGPGTLTMDVTTVTTTLEPNVLSAGYTGKIVVPTVGTTVIVDNGNDAPITHGIPVDASKSYSFSFYTQGLASASAIAQITWYNSQGVLISSSAPATLSVTTAWTKVSTTATSPVGAEYAGISIVFPTGTFWIDLVQFAAGSPIAFAEARGIDVYLTASKINLVTNSTFEASAYSTGWTIANGTASRNAYSGANVGPAGVYGGSACLSLTSTGSGTSASTSAVLSASDAGKFYTFSIYGKNVAGTSTQNISLTIVNAGKTTIVTPTPATPVTFTTSWNRFTVTVFIPTDYTAATVTATIASTVNTAGGQIYLDSAQLQVGLVATDYFDGNNPNGGEFYSLASGDVHTTQSYMYDNKAVKIPRLKIEVPRFLPLGTPYIVRTQNQIEFSGFA